MPFFSGAIQSQPKDKLLIFESGGRAERAGVVAFLCTLHECVCLCVCVYDSAAHQEQAPSHPQLPTSPDCLSSSASLSGSVPPSLPVRNVFM